MKVSVCVIAYNQEKYIAQALHGILSQSCDFEFEIIISDDCSSDMTESIIDDVIAAHGSQKNIIKIENSQNMGMISNFLQVLNLCQGEYVAICEGDDYWVSSEKLQTQVDFLDSHPDFAICHHYVKVLDEASGEFLDSEVAREAPQVSTIHDLAAGNFINTPSVVLRNDFALGAWFKDSPIGDWALYMAQVKDRKIMRLSEEMAVYRIHSENNWASKSVISRLRKTIDAVNLVMHNVDLTQDVRWALQSLISKYQYEETMLLEEASRSAEKSMLSRGFKKLKVLLGSGKSLR